MCYINLCESSLSCALTLIHINTHVLKKSLSLITDNHVHRYIYIAIIVHVCISLYKESCTLVHKLHLHKK